jgi:Flp pilus assembly protein CpaB
MSPAIPYRGRRAGFAPFMVPVAILGLLVALSATLWAVGVLDFSRFGRPAVRAKCDQVSVPVLARAVPAYTRLMRDHFWDPKRNDFTIVCLSQDAVTREMLTRFGDIWGRVLDHEKQPGFVFTNADFLPKGTREGIVAGIPAGKRAIRVEASKVDGLYGLRVGDRFDLVATLPIDSTRGGGGQTFNVGGVYGQQMALQARLSNWQKQATVRVMVQNGVVVEPMTTRQVPFFSNTLTQGGITRMKPVQEIVIAVDPDEVARLTEAIAVEAKISTVPRSGRPDDPQDSITPDLQPVSPFTGPGSTPGPVRTAASDQSAPVSGSSAPFSMVETISGTKRELTAVPRR